MMGKTAKQSQLGAGMASSRWNLSVRGEHLPTPWEEVLLGGESKVSLQSHCRKRREQFSCVVAGSHHSHKPKKGHLLFGWVDTGQLPDILSLPILYRTGRKGKNHGVQYMDPGGLRDVSHRFFLIPAGFACYEMSFPVAAPWSLWDQPRAAPGSPQSPQPLGTAVPGAGAGTETSPRCEQ